MKKVKSVTLMLLVLFCITLNLGGCANQGLIPNGKYIEDFAEIVKLVKAISTRSGKQLIAVIGAGDIHKIIGELEL